MKSTHPVQIAAQVLIVFTLASFLLAGCQSTGPKNWNKQVGSYTYDQAVKELGRPENQATTDGKTVAEWPSLRLTFGNDGRLASWQKRP